MSQASDAGSRGDQFGPLRAQVNTPLTPQIGTETYTQRVWRGWQLGRDAPLLPGEVTMPTLSVPSKAKANRPGWRWGPLPGTGHLASPDPMESHPNSGSSCVALALNLGFLICETAGFL